MKRRQARRFCISSFRWRSRGSDGPKLGSSNYDPDCGIERPLPGVLPRHPAIIQVRNLSFEPQPLRFAADQPLDARLEIEKALHDSMRPSSHMRLAARRFAARNACLRRSLGSHQKSLRAHGLRLPQTISECGLSAGAMILSRSLRKFTGSSSGTPPLIVVRRRIGRR